MDLEKIKEVIELMQASGTTKLSVREGDFALELQIGGERAPAVAPRVEVSVEGEGHLVTSPMVGTFFASPEPGAKPFVSAGSRVQKGDTIGIVEAMKVMNEVKARHTGVVTEVLVGDSDPVEFGSPLIRIV